MKTENHTSYVYRELHVFMRFLRIARFHAISRESHVFMQFSRIGRYCAILGIRNECDSQFLLVYKSFKVVVTYLNVFLNVVGNVLEEAKFPQVVHVHL